MPEQREESAEKIAEKVETEKAAENFYKKAPFTNKPLAPWGSEIWPAGRYSKIESQAKMNQFIDGHVKFHLNGITKQEQVPQEEREEVQEYNVQRRLRDFDKQDVDNYIIHMNKKRCFWDYSLNSLYHPIFKEGSNLFIKLC